MFLRCDQRGGSSEVGMSGKPTKLKLFTPKRTRSEALAEITDHVARAIIHNETASREAKTARLRKARRSI